MIRIEPKEKPRAPWRAPAVVAIVVAALVAWRAIVGAGPEGIATAPPSAAPPSSAAPPLGTLVAPRCEEISAEPFFIGEAPAAPRSPPAEDASSGGAADEPAEELEDPIAPFAVEIGRGAVFDGGFAVGARRDAEGGAVGMIATLGLDGKGGKLVRLGRLRGDLDPPVVAGAGASVLAVMAEPNAGGRAIKVAKVTGTDVIWGPEFSEGRDESAALDLAVAGAYAVVVWDDLLGVNARHSSILLASLDLATMRVTSPAHPVSPASADAEWPRLTNRPGGYWLAYVLRGEPDAKKQDARKGKHDDDEDRELGETITTSYIQLVPLDEGGAPAGAARAVTPKSGHVLSFDLELGDGGGALLAWRDDDTPTGSTGGRVSVVLARLGGVSEPRVLAEETLGAGVPDLLPGWISLASVNGATRLAAMSPKGEALDELAPERSLGAGEPIAATSDVILWARPMGKTMRLGVVRCRQRPAGDAGASAGDAGAASGG